jgi:hypothetical protein
VSVFRSDYDGARGLAVEAERWRHLV